MLYKQLFYKSICFKIINISEHYSQIKKDSQYAGEFLNKIIIKKIFLKKKPFFEFKFFF